jgi:acyl-CoA synthetase (AMP-forming)/AMP-acid ligase II
MRRSVENWGDREAVVAGCQRLTYAEAWDRGCRLANALLETGLQPGDRVAVLEDNSLEAADFYLATTIANLVRVPLYPRNARASHLHMIGQTGCRVAVVAANYRDELHGMDAELPGLLRVMVRDAGYEDFLASQSSTDPNPVVREDDYYIIRHTAGTSGLSKGVAYTHRTWLATGHDWFYTFPPLELGDACLHVGAISHGSGYFFTPTWISGGRNVLVPRFDPAETLEIMEQEPISYMFAVPTMLNLMARQPSAVGRDWSRLKVICVGGAPIAEATARLAQDVFGSRVYQIYGQTEVLPVTTIGPTEWFSDVPGSNPLRSAGRAVPYVEIRILDVESHQVLSAGQQGEIAARADGQMSGFWENPEATAERMVDGWVLTGDVGMLDDNGYLYVLDRASDMIVSGGFNIYPAELENVICELPSVIEVAVFAIPDDRWGESPAAVCVVDDPSRLTEQAVIDICRDRLGSYKKPSKVVLTTEPLPKSPVGKVLRKVLREPYWEGHGRRVGGA